MQKKISEGMLGPSWPLNSQNLTYLPILLSFKFLFTMSKLVDNFVFTCFALIPKKNLDRAIQCFASSKNVEDTHSIDR